MRPKVVVVEGRNDASRLKQIYPDIKIITTNGSAIKEDSVQLLKELDDTHDIILFLDPDHAGERIRRLLSKQLKHIYHAFIDRDVAYSKNMKKIGIEHASEDDIKNALGDIQAVHKKSTSDVTYSFLHDTKLTGNKDSKALRDFVSKKLRLGHVNGKTLYQRLKMFEISQKQVIEAISESSSKEEIRTELPQG
ncbi:MAG TPA: ribonuclease M5 [Acholeplasmataceae bacterium]|nr:MAG: ribonuclease M5 [Tenericutes bacterium GWD2_38_27]OHE38815.1 MAG: ribonuclease M5 [Tenericutes bacterium GWE2_38_8]OHE46391.1 MAG: ribonuclease M5 [Tenericutes bacterium GWF2_38_8]HBY65208.1 ribonuclease M5 [Acholeplasmataceae bacterium]